LKGGFKKGEEIAKLFKKYGLSRLKLNKIQLLTLSQVRGILDEAALLPAVSRKVQHPHVALAATRNVDVQLA